MKSARIITLMLIASFGGVGITQAAVLRRQSEENPLSLLKSDPRPIAAGFEDNNASDSATAEVMKKAKKKKKKTKAS